jgi:hypothetical protein
MSGTDDRSPGSIEDLALSWGLTPEQARKVAATAVALAREAYPMDEYVPQQRGTTPPLPRQRRESPANGTDGDTTTDREERDTEATH